MRVAVEFRHRSWHCEEIFAVLEAHRTGYCVVSGAKLPRGNPAGSCPDRDVGVVVACGRWRVHCHIGAAPGWPFSYFSPGRVARGIAPGHPTSRLLI